MSAASHALEQQTPYGGEDLSSQRCGFWRGVSEAPVKEGDIFSITFVHSVNQSPVTDEFLVLEEGFKSHRTLFTSFGAGMETGTEEGQVLTYEEDGTMVLSGFQNHYERFQLIVGTVSDHMLKISGKEISLRELCGKNASVEISIRN